MTPSPVIVRHIPLPDSGKLQAVTLKIPRRKKAPVVPKQVAARIEEYQRLYRKKYGVAVSVTWDKPWIRIGSSPGVSLQRLRQLIQQIS